MSGSFLEPPDGSSISLQKELPRQNVINLLKDRASKSVPDLVSIIYQRLSFGGIFNSGDYITELIADNMDKKRVINRLTSKLSTMED